MSGAITLITGATGVVGAQVAEQCAARGDDVVAVVRRPRMQHARAEAPTHRDVVGDVSAPRAGIAAARRRALRGRVRSIIHCAAVTALDEHADADAMRVNVAGTRHVLALADELGAERVFLMSTLFLVAAGAGPALERLVEPTAHHRNPYEASKAEAERIFFDHLARSRRDGAVLRLPLVLGHSRTGATRRLTGFFSLAKILHSVGPLCGGPGGRGVDDARATLPITITCDPAATMNALPVDVVGRTIIDVIDAHRGGPQIYHLANGTPPAIGRLIADGLDVLGVDGVHLAPGRNGPAVPDHVARLQQLVDAGLATYAPYLRGEPVFCRTHLERLLGRDGLPDHAIDRAYVRRVLDYCIARRWRLGAA